MEKTLREKIVDDLVDQVLENGCDEEFLDETVYDVMSTNAMVINNEGWAAQVNFLIDEIGITKIREIIKNNGRTRHDDRVL